MENIFNSLIDLISKIEQIQSIGKTGSIDFNIADKSDIDVFVFCDDTPDLNIRTLLYNSIDANLHIKTHDFESKNWGTLDLIYVNDIEICLMYFKIINVKNEINDILEGNRIKKEDYFFPIGRCASLKNINILFDKNNFLKNLKEELNIFPNKLYEKSIGYHLSKLNEIEDIERAVALNDVLFYHYALDVSLEYFLQLLFTINRCFYPSRKRNLVIIEQFKNKPIDCINRLLKIIELGSNEKTIKESYNKWQELNKELVKCI